MNNSKIVTFPTPTKTIRNDIIESEINGVRQTVMETKKIKESIENKINSNISETDIKEIKQELKTVQNNFHSVDVRLTKIETALSYLPTQFENMLLKNNEKLNQESKNTQRWVIGLVVTITIFIITNFFLRK